MLIFFAALSSFLTKPDFLIFFFFLLPMCGNEEYNESFSAAALVYAQTPAVCPHYFPTINVPVKS